MKVLLLQISMYLNIHTEVQIGNVLFKNVNDIEIMESWQQITQTARVILPRNLYINGERIEDVKAALPERSPVVIRIGYNAELYQEFEGYVREVKPAAPLVIECEDEMINLKAGEFTKGWKNVKLKAVLQYLAPAYQLQVEDITLSDFEVDKETPAQVFKRLQDSGIYTYFIGKTLYSGFAYRYTFDRWLYHFQKNMKANDLKYESADKFPVQVKAISHQKNGKKLEILIPEAKPENASVRTLNFGPMTEADLRKYATAEKARMNFNGFRGTLTGFGFPRTKHGDIAELRNARYPEYNGAYIIDKVVKRVQPVAYERINTLGPKV